MNDGSFYDDVPIQTPDQDNFGLSAFADALTASIRGLKAPVGTTLALNGKWGSGKSSAINLIQHYLGAEGKEEIERSDTNNEAVRSRVSVCLEAWRTWERGGDRFQ